jgi:hypothetical protein
MEKTISTGQIILIFCLLGIIIISGCWGCPAYKVYRARMTGEAEYERAEQNRRIKILEAQAELQSANYLLQKDTVRAWGIARSNQIIGQSITEAYLRWLFIDKLGDDKNSVIYLPTEAGIPILEANRLKDAH